MDRAAQRSRAARDARGGPFRFQLSHRVRSDGRNPVGGAVIGVEISPINFRDTTDIERAVAAFARGSNDGLIALPGVQPLIHRELIIALAARQKLPAVYPYRYHVTSGGLICYGPDENEQYPQAARYVDRILKGAKTA